MAKSKRKKRGRPHKEDEINWLAERVVLEALIAEGWSLRRLAARYDIQHHSLKIALIKLGLETHEQALRRQMIEAFVDKRLEEKVPPQPFSCIPPRPHHGLK